MTDPTDGALRESRADPKAFVAIFERHLGAVKRFLRCVVLRRMASCENPQVGCLLKRLLRVAAPLTFLLFDPLSVPDEVRERATAVVLTAPNHERDARRLGLPVHTPPADTCEDWVEKFGVDPDRVRGVESGPLARCGLSRTGRAGRSAPSGGRAAFRTRPPARLRGTRRR
jgi:hypothetical protein